MKKKLILYVFAMATFVLSFAQPRSGGMRANRLEALKIAFMTKYINLSADEAQKFWPIYNVFDDNQSELRHEKMRAILNRFRPGNVDKLSEKEASVLLVQIEKIEEDLFNLRKKFIKDLQNVISAKKIIKLKKAEEDFNRELLKQMREKRRG